jgi:hypothetical protein
VLDDPLPIFGAQEESRYITRADIARRVLDVCSSLECRRATNGLRAARNGDERLTDSMLGKKTGNLEDY